ncbi:hypothetical protein BGZ47_002495, partial [Haplosporangium gracile]
NNYYYDSSSNSTVSPYSLHKIRHLELRGHFMSYVCHVSVFRGHLQFIQSLTITAPRKDSPIPLFTLLADFPALKSLTVAMQAGTFTELSHGDNLDSIVGPAPLYDASNIFTDEYRLEQFCLNYVRVDRRILERLIVTCPDLRAFNVKSLDIQMSLSDDGTEEGVAIAEAEENNARQQLIDLAAKHCPKMEWYSFDRLGRDTSENHLKMVARSFPEQKMYSMAFHNYSETILDTLVIRDLLSRMTVLQIQTCLWSKWSSIVLDKILCMVPRLLHLLGSETSFSTTCLWQPPAPVELKQPFTTVGDLKRRERKEQRRARQLARTGGRHYTAPATDTPTVDPSISVTWQVYSLKTLELNLGFDSALVDFTDYISRHGLFRNLVIFNLQISVLKIGQRMNFTNTRAGLAAAAAAADVAASSGINFQLGQPVRYPNELLALRSLRCLEECILRVADLPGTLVPKDLKFMQRKQDFQTVSFLATRNRKRRKTKSSKKSVPKMAATGVTDKINDDEEDEEDEEEEEKEKEEERWKNETFWPVLNVFHIYYQKKLPSTDTGKIVEAFERFRPGNFEVAKNFLPSSNEGVKSFALLQVTRVSINESQTVKSRKSQGHRCRPIDITIKDAFWDKLVAAITEPFATGYQDNVHHKADGDNGYKGYPYSVVYDLPKASLSPLERSQSKFAVAVAAGTSSPVKPSENAIDDVDITKEEEDRCEER